MKLETHEVHCEALEDEMGGGKVGWEAGKSWVSAGRHTDLHLPEVPWHDQQLTSMTGYCQKFPGMTYTCQKFPGMTSMTSS